MNPGTDHTAVWANGKIAEAPSPYCSLGSRYLNFLNFGVGAGFSATRGARTGQALT